MSLVRRHPVRAFVLLAWALAWAYWIPMALRGEVVTPGGPISHFPGLMSPLVAAVVVTGIVRGRAGLREYAARLVRWRVPFRWYAFAALPYGLFLGALGLLALLGADLPAPTDFAEFSGLPVLAVPVVILLVLLFNGYGEEGGWRGFLTPQLLVRRGPLLTSLMVAAAWFVWHVPSFWVIDGYRVLGPAIVPMMAVGLLFGAIVLTWMYIGSGGSVLIVSLWHLGYNFASATTAGRGLVGMLVWIAIGAWAFAIVVAWLLVGEPRSRPFLARLRDGALISVLRSPLGRLIPGLTVIGFHGRRSGHALRTPVECVRDGGRVYVLVAHADRKQWWRNVMADPNVTVEVEGQEVAGVAVVHTAGAEADEDRAAYLRHRPRTARVLSKLDAESGVPVRAARSRPYAWVRVELAPTS